MFSAVTVIFYGCINGRVEGRGVQCCVIHSFHVYPMNIDYIRKDLGLLKKSEIIDQQSAEGHVPVCPQSVNGMKTWAEEMGGVHLN